MFVNIQFAKNHDDKKYVLENQVVKIYVKQSMCKNMC